MSEPDDTDDIPPDTALADAIAALPGNAEPEATAEPVEAQPAADAPAPPADPAAQPSAYVQVPLAKYQGERQRRQAAEARIAELERLAQQRQQPAPQPAAAATPELPDAPTVSFDDNPGEHLRQLGAIDARNKQREIDGINEKIKAYEAEERQLRERRQFDEDKRQLTAAYKRAWADAAGIDQRTEQVAKPELLEAYKYFGDSIISEAMAGGYDFDQAKEILVNIELQEAWRAFSNDINPADVILARARARGWTPQPAAPAVQPQPAVAAPAADQSVKRAAAVSKLSAASGGAAPSQPTLREINAMSPKEYDKYMRRNPDTFEKLIAGAA